ncbi:MAG: DUF3108 domain-containing protein [Candidatus Cloacimonetes bacterium]|nr:DUF3108 domain-containing protein [Candidatus Cloacimonadota bacterium]
MNHTNILRIIFLVSGLFLKLFLLSFENDEKLIFKIKYGVITAGEASLTLSETAYRDSISCYKITSLANTNSFFDKIYKVRDVIESIWDKDKLVSHKFTKNLKEGKYRQRRTHLYYPEQNLSFYLKYSRRTKKYDQTRMDIPVNTQDILSSFYWFRLQDLEVGKTFTINVTADGRNYPANVVVHRKEKIKTIFGKKECFVVEPILEGEAIFKQTAKIYIWLTADEYKIPIRLQSTIIFGSFKAILIDAENVPYQKK